MSSGICSLSQTNFMFICKKQKLCTCHVTSHGCCRTTHHWWEHENLLLHFFSALLQCLPCCHTAVDLPSEVICILGAILEVTERDRLCEVLLNFIHHGFLWNRQAIPLPLSVGTGAQFFIVGNKMSISRTRAKAYVIHVRWDSCWKHETSWRNDLEHG